MRQLLILMLVSVIRITGMSAQDCSLTLHGYILDATTGVPVEFGTVSIHEAGVDAISDTTGYFVIHNICRGKYHVLVESSGGDPVRIFMKIERDTSVYFYIDLRNRVLNEVTVSGKRQEGKETQTHHAIGSAGIKNSAGQNLSDIASRISGVHSLRNGSGISKPIIHGMLGNRIAVINNGLLQAGQQWGADHAPEIDPNSAEFIRVVKGSDAIEYGSQAMGGAIIVESGPLPEDPHPHGFAGYSYETNGRGHGVFVKTTGSASNLAWRISGTLRKQGDRFAPGYFLTNTGSRESNAAFQFAFRPKEELHHELYYSLFHTGIGIFAGSHISNLTDLEEAIFRQEPLRVTDQFSYALSAPRQNVSHHLIRYSGKKFVSSSNFLTWSYGVQSNHRQEYDIRRGDRTDIAALDLQLWSHQAALKWRSEKKNTNYQVGLQAGWIDNANDYDTGILPLIPDFTKGTGSVFVQYKFPLGKLEIETGARYDLHKVHVWEITKSLPRQIIERFHTFQDVSFALGGFLKCSDVGELRWHTTLVRRSPEVNELYSNGLHQGIAGIEEGDPGLHPETSAKSIVTQSLAVEDVFHAEASLYAHWIHDYIFLQPDQELRLTIRGAFPVYYYKQGHALVRGIDLNIVSDFSNTIELRSALSLIRGNLTEMKRPLSFMPPLRWDASIAWSGKDSEKFKETRISVEGSFTGQQKHWDQEAELTAPPGAYFLVNGNAETSLRAGSETFHIGIIGYNLLNVRYRNYLNRLRYFADEQGRSVRVTIRYEF